MTYQPKTYRKDGGDTMVIAAGGKIDVETGGFIFDPASIRNVRVRATAAQINATGGLEVLAGITGKKIRMVDCKLIAIGGNAAGATGVQLKSGSVVLIDAKVAGLTQSTVARAGDTNINVLADGASFVAQAAGAGVVVIKDGSNLTTATHVDVILDYVIEE